MKIFKIVLILIVLFHVFSSFIINVKIIKTWKTSTYSSLNVCGKKIVDYLEYFDNLCIYSMWAGLTWCGFYTEIYFSLPPPQLRKREMASMQALQPRRYETYKFWNSRRNIKFKKDLTRNRQSERVGPSALPWIPEIEIHAWPDADFRPQYAPINFPVFVNWSHTLHAQRAIW